MDPMKSASAASEPPTATEVRKSEKTFRTFVPEDVDRNYVSIDFKRKMDNVDDRLWLGEKHVIFTPYIHYFTMNFDDAPSVDVLSMFYAVTDFIHCALENPASGVFVHCAVGVSRSTTFVLAYMIRKYRITALEAFMRVYEKREFVFPNVGFQEQLLHWEAHILRGEPIPPTTKPITHRILSPDDASHSATGRVDVIIPHETEKLP